MTRYEIHVDRLIAHDTPADRASELAPRVEARLSALARRDAVGGGGEPGAAPDDLADRVAAEVWRHVVQAREETR